MKIIVPIKQVIDAGARIRVKSDGSGVDPSGVRMIVNPFDEIALEEAVRLKEAGKATEVIAVTIAGEPANEALRSALARGADRAVRVDHAGILEPLAIAKAIAKLVRNEGAQLVLAGKQSIDGDNNQVGQMIAALLGWPQATFASKLTLEGDEITVTREVDGGLETLAMPLPAVVTADLRLNQPRHASLPNIMKAKKKPIETLSSQDVGLSADPRVTVLETRAPQPRAKGVRVTDVDELISRLRDDAKIV